MVAPSFQGMTLLSEPYLKNNKTYIDVRNEKTQNIRSVRWYTEKEYEKAYGSKNNQLFSIKDCRGFSEGPIIVIRNIQTPHEECWLRRSVARHAADVGWYFASTDSIPLDAPSTFKYIPLTWEEASSNGKMKPASELARILT